MTIKEIKEILKGIIGHEWIEFKDKADKEYFLKSIKTDDLEIIFSELEVTEFTNRELIEELREEYEGI